MVIREATVMIRNSLAFQAAFAVLGNSLATNRADLMTTFQLQHDPARGGLVGCDEFCGRSLAHLLLRKKQKGVFRTTYVCPAQPEDGEHGGLKSAGLMVNVTIAERPKRKDQLEERWAVVRRKLCSVVDD